MKLVILDRDGVINHDSDAYIKSPEEWRPIAGSLEAIARLTREGYRVVVATNQSGVARGLFDMDTLGKIHAKMVDAVRAKGGEIDGIFFCPHGPDDKCHCRKPEPGLYEEIADRLKISLDGVYSVGDSERDVIAARAAAARPVLVRTGKGERTLRKGKNLGEVPVYPDLAAFVDGLLHGELSG
ncbi:MAG: D-glycero-beta-D-manno-heptose 1,7-bisphosphate 7-phosphatase [Gammaproteobacteria bacterium]|nr:MAG: D-glycero-beta-D-manno-heptose 1,7-bisphosphate 7-phosphatase [Gammaproteobacteria bacterium]